MVQEVVLGSKWLVACGSDIIDGDKLISIFRNPSDKEAKQVSRWKESRAYELLRERNHRKMYGSSSFINLMLRFYQLESKFPGDKILGLSGLCLKAQDSLDTQGRNYLPDMNQNSVHRIYDLVARWNESTSNVERVLRHQKDLCKALVILADKTAPGYRVSSDDYAAFFHAMLNGHNNRDQLVKTQYLAARILAARLPLPGDQLDDASQSRQSSSTGRQGGTRGTERTDRKSSPYLPSYLRSRVEMTDAGVSSPSTAIIRSPQLISSARSASRLGNPVDRRDPRKSSMLLLDVEE